eukprot:5299162-Alexandrium_andersonii.AAC.1
MAPGTALAPVAAAADMQQFQMPMPGMPAMPQPSMIAWPSSQPPLGIQGPSSSFSRGPSLSS